MTGTSPAPWAINNSGGAMTIVARDRSVLAVIVGGGDAAPFEEGNAALMGAAPDLRDAARLALAFHAGGPWDGERAAEWTRITGSKDATTKILCDFIRTALAKAEAGR